MLRPLILDLDFTLLHLELVPDSIEVPGRTRSAYIAPSTSEILRDLSSKFALVIATARSWDGTEPVVTGLQARGVPIRGLIMEDGALLGSPVNFAAFEPNRDWEMVRQRAQLVAGNRSFEWQFDFKACLVARCADGEASRDLMEIWALQLDEIGDHLRVFRDGRKVYLVGREVDKWTALQQLLGEQAAIAAGVGDGANDLCWLRNIQSPATFASAKPEVVAVVREKSGFISELEGHAGIGDILVSFGS